MKAFILANATVFLIIGGAIGVLVLEHRGGENGLRTSTFPPAAALVELG